MAGAFAKLVGNPKSRPRVEGYTEKVSRSSWLVAREGDGRGSSPDRRPRTVTATGVAPGSVHEGDPLPPSNRRWRSLVVAIVVLAAIWPIAGSARLFPNLTRNADEVVWLSQMDVLESGALTTAAPARNPASYTPWFAQMRNGRYVYRYPPLFPALLAASDIVTGTPRVGLGLASAWAILAVYLLVAELARRRGVALLAAVLVGACPLYFLTAAMFLGYVFFIALFCTAAWLLARGARTGRYVDLALAGFTFGLAVFDRPYDTVLLGLPWLVWFVWRCRRRAPPGLALVALGALLPIGAMLVYNWHLTGDALKPPFLLWDSLDTVGFGNRYPPAVDFTPILGAIGVGRMWRDLLFWSVPGLGLTAVATLLSVRPARTQLAPLIGMLLTLPIGWIGFWASYFAPLRYQLGPVYVLPLLVPLAALTAVGVEAAWAGSGRRAHTRGMVATVAGCAVILGLFEGATHVSRWQLDAGGRKSIPPTPTALAQASDAIGRSPALVFLPEPSIGFLPPLHNSPALDGPRLYVAELPGQDPFVIAAEHPDRRAYRLVGRPDGSVQVQPLQ